MGGKGSRGGPCFRGVRDPDVRQREEEGGQVHIRLLRRDLPERFAHFTDVRERFQGDRPVQDKLHGGGHVPGIFCNEKTVFAGLQDPGRLPFMERGQPVEREGQGKGFLRARRQEPGFTEGSEALPFGGEGAGGAGGIQLDDLPAGGAAGVPDLYGDGQARGAESRADGFGREGSIGQAGAEGIAGFHPEGVKIPVAHINAVRVVFLGQLAVPVGKGRRGGIVLIAEGPGIGQPPGGIHLSGQDVRGGVPALAAGLGHEQQRGDLPRIHKGKVDDAADVQQHDEGQAEGGQGFQFPLLPFAQEVVALFRAPVRELAGDPGDHIDDGVGAGGVLPQEGQLRQLRNEGGMGVVQFPRIAVVPGFPVDRFLAPLFAVGEFFVVTVQVRPVHDGEAGVQQALLHGDGVAGIHVAAAGAALDGVAGAPAVQGELRALLQGQDPVVLQQDHAFRGGPPGDRTDLLFTFRYTEIGLSRVFSHDAIPPVFSSGQYGSFPICANDCNSLGRAYHRVGFFAICEFFLPVPSNFGSAGCMYL